MIFINDKTIYKKILLSVIIPILILSGCSKSGQPSGVVTETSQSRYYRMEEVNLPNRKAGLSIPDGGKVYMGNTPFRLVGDGIYNNAMVEDEKGENGEWYIQGLNLTTMEWNNLSLKNKSFTQGGVCYKEISTLYYPSLDGSIYVKIYDEKGDGYLGELKDGKVEVLHSISTEISSSRFYYLIGDRDGNFYHLDKNQMGIICYDSSLNKTEELETSGPVYGILQETSGSPVYWYGLDGDKQAIVQELKGKRTILKGFAGIGTDYRAALTPDGILYLADNQNVWRMEGESLDKVYSFPENGYIIQEFHGMDIGEEGLPRFLVDLDGEPVLLIMKEIAKPLEKQEILVAFTRQHYGIERSLARFNRKSEKYHVTMLLPDESENVEDYVNRIRMEMGAGRGPDILGHDMVSDLDSYVRNGYLSSVDDLFGDTTQYVQGALDGYRVDGKRYGVPYDCSFQIAAYSGESAEGRSSFTLPELMEAIKASDCKVIERGAGKVETLFSLGVMDEENKTYIDWEKGISYLDEEPFQELLAFVASYITIEDDSEKAFIYADGIDFQMMSQMKDVFEYFEGDAKVLGFPRQEGNGNYVTSRAMYLNASAECEEGAREFLKYVISHEEQEKYITFDIKNLVIPGVTEYTGYKTDFPISLKAMDALIRLELEEDQNNLIHTEQGDLQIGSMYTGEQVEQFRFLVENAKPVNLKIKEIEPIFFEELTPYFTGAVSGKEAAKKLHNRVQLYLDEK